MLFTILFGRELRHLYQSRRTTVIQRRRWSLIAPALGLLLACGRTPPRDVVAEAAAALGGQARIDAVRTLAIEGEGRVYALGQNRTLDSELLSWQVSGYRREADLVAGRWREESVRTPTFVTGWPAPIRLLEGYDAGVAYDVEDGSAGRRDSLVAMGRRVELYHDPVSLLRAVGQGDVRLVAAGRETRSDTVDLVTAAGDTLTLTVDGVTHLPRRIVSKGHEPALGDVDLVTELDEFVLVDGLKVPARIRKKVDTTLVADIRVIRTEVNPEPGDLRAPASVRSAAEPPSAANVTVTEEAPGIWYLAGEGHHSVVIELADHLTLIEAPVDDRRALAVIARARALRPEKPLTEVINTHHHFDHSGGIRAAVSEGLTVVTHESNRRFFEAMVARPARVLPDAFARRPRPLSLETVADHRVLGDATRRLEVYQITGSRHCATMLMIYLPAERLLVEADAYQPPPLSGPPPIWHPHAGNLLENIERRGLRVDRVLPIHGRPVPFRELVAAAAIRPPPN